MTKKITRSQLEELSTVELQQLICEAVSVMAARADATAAERPKSQVPTFVVPSAAAAMASSPSIFTFGAASSGSTAGFSFSTSPFQLGSSSGASPFQLGTSSVEDSKLLSNLFKPTATTDPKKDEGTAARPADAEDGSDAEAVADEEVTTIVGWKPSITLEVKDRVQMGDEDDEQLYAQRSKLFRWRDGEWKERGIGEARLLKSRESGQVRFLMRQERTGKIVANHSVIKHETYCDLRLNKDSDKIWCWSALDYADEDFKVEEFGLKFATAELANAFKEAFDGAKVGV
mmetsp:Transcript_41895/g.76126  ORF Transcript_41895/g.76126 Transcript_41895/m.76126 type:complete len:288 (-) Transcript_41895:88-951(-)